MGRPGTASAFIALAYRRFDVITMCDRYSTKLDEEITNLLVWLTTAKKTWGFGLRVTPEPNRRDPQIPVHGGRRSTRIRRRPF
ncbi:hypothetical protein A6024_04425 [Rhodovulum sulfidophilum]|nr:hypothetical protein A6W98_04575 [Rhodovulum sulfidophilum DSM 1374]ANB37234.1 hypothetical protein A6024_04425 [Rhodovulum sulfidophilum]